MTGKSASAYDATTTSMGHDLSESSYLDAHFEAMRPEYEAAIQAVGIQPGWHVLDAGCGSGGFLQLLAGLIGSKGHISALDLDPENIKVVETLVKSWQIDCSVEARIGEVTSLPYGDNKFDAVWCANVTQYLTDGELQKMLAEFRRVVQPDGLVAVKDFDLTLQQFLPGDPVTLWKLIEKLRPINSQFRGTLRVLDLPKWLRQAGLIDIRYETTVCERQAPLRPVEQEFLGHILRFSASMAENIGLPEPMLSTWRKLGDTDSPDHIMKHPDFYYREGFVVITARVPD